MTDRQSTPTVNTRLALLALAVGGFAIGAAGLFAVQTVQLDQPGFIPSAQAATR